MGVDEARGHQASLGIQDAMRRGVHLAHRRDAVAVDGQVAPKSRAAAAVDQGPVADQEIVHRPNTPARGPEPGPVPRKESTASGSPGHGVAAEKPPALPPLDPPVIGSNPRPKPGTP